MSTMEQEHYRQQATMSTAHHTNGHHYGQGRASSNVGDQTVTHTSRDYAHIQGHNVSSAPNTHYASYHRDIYTAAPTPYFIHRVRQCIKPKSTTHMERHFVHREHPPHFFSGFTTSKYYDTW